MLRTANENRRSPKLNNLGIYTVLSPKIEESRKNDFVGNLGNLSDSVDVNLSTAQARMLASINAIYVPWGNYFTIYKYIIPRWLMKCKWS